jgi:hypothetical protein
MPDIYDQAFELKDEALLRNHQTKAIRGIIIDCPVSGDKAALSGSP